VSGNWQFGPFVLDADGGRLWRAGQELALTPKALEVLTYMVERAGQVLPREQLLEALWPETYVDDHALSVQIGEIRKALGDDVRESRYVETRHRRGYCFKAGVKKIAPPPEAAAAAPAIHETARPLMPETRYARSGDVDIAYQVLGDGPIDLVFVMGWVSHLEYFWTEPSFARFLRRLTSFSRLILFDKRGTGLSDRVPLSELPSLELRMDDLRAVMDAAGSARAAICGISEGGPMSALFAATYPEKTLALVMIGAYAKRLRDPDYPWGPTIEEREHFFQEIRDHWGGPVGLEERAPSRASDPGFREWWAAYLRMAASPGAAVALTKMNAQIDVRAVLPAVRVPTLVIHRSGDRCLKVEEGRYAASLIPGARFVLLPGEDHLPFVGDQDSILDEVEGFLRDVRHTMEPDRVLATVLAAQFPPETGDRLHAQIRGEIKWYRGIEAGRKGDGIVATFDGPARAVRCACAVAGHASRLGLEIRAGLHTGECENPSGPAASGPAVDFAAMIQARAAPGEILVSSTLRDLVAGSGLYFEAQGAIQTNGMEWRLFTVQRGRGITFTSSAS
jgi:DNA-binding winged helix-turn-helix (wHTH) protein/pimeloyl-ACP methyl ester carboxylesterase